MIAAGCSRSGAVRVRRRRSAARPPSRGTSQWSATHWCQRPESGPATAPDGSSRTAPRVRFDRLPPSGFAMSAGSFGVEGETRDDLLNAGFAPFGADACAVPDLVEYCGHGGDAEPGVA